ncbi:MAG: galactokinase, partial [Bacteroidota bacterium]
GGFDVVFAGDIPQGAGLSSSAALECATAFALDQTFGLGLDRTQIAQYTQRAENEFVGVNCGIMDQFASVFGQHQQAICIDCRSLGYTAIPLDLGEYQLVMVDSQVTHNLADSEYNTRRRECEEAVARLQAFYPEVVALRDVTPQQVQTHQADLPELLYRRARYIAEENERVTLATQALKKGDLEALGALLYQSHDGMRYGFEITCPELDFLVEFTQTWPTVLGSRMMGGGFGGCTLNLVAQSSVDRFCEEVSQTYATEFGQAPAIYPVHTANGTSEVTPLPA